MVKRNPGKTCWYIGSLSDNPIIIYRVLQIPGRAIWFQIMMWPNVVAQTNRLDGKKITLQLPQRQICAKSINIGLDLWTTYFMATQNHGDSRSNLGPDSWILGSSS